MIRVLLTCKSQNCMTYIVVIYFFTRLRELGCKISPPQGLSVSESNTDFFTMNMKQANELDDCLAPVRKIVWLTACNLLYILTPQMGDPSMAQDITTTNTVETFGDTEMDQTTKFVTEAEKVVSLVTDRVSLPRLLYDSSSMPNSESIAAFLGKPMPLDAGTLGTADNFSTFTARVLPNDILTNVIYRNKLSGYLGFRATTVITFVINGNPFQQGKYLINWVPSGGAQANASNTMWVNAHLSTLTQRTTARKLVLDVNCDSEGIMKIPFDSSLNYFPLSSLGDANKFGNWGTLKLSPYSALVAPSGSNFVNYSIYVHFEDIELVGAAQPQMNRAFVKEAEKAGQGPVSSVLGTLANTANSLVPIPSISSYANTASWALEIMAGCAKVFGLSKPMNMGPTQRVTRAMAMYAGNVDGFDQGAPIAAVSENNVPMMSGIGSTDIDEMSLTYIATIPAWYATYTWDTGSSYSTNIATISVFPNYFTNSGTLATKTIYHQTPLSFVQNFFDLWRGSIVFIFKFVKTSFHSGRLAFTFSPSEPKSNTSGFLFTNSPYCHRQIVDIRTSNEVIITVPFISSSPYLNRAEQIGLLTIDVIDSLAVTGTVSSTISILTEVCGGPDIEFAVPTEALQVTPCMNITPQMGAVSNRNDCDIDDDMIGSSKIVGHPILNAELCIGERILSFRSYLKFFVPLTGVIGTTTTSKIEWVVPFAIPVAWFNAVATIVPCNTDTDNYALLASCFVYSRGGVKIKKINTAGNSFFVGTAQPTIMSPLFTFIQTLSLANTIDRMLSRTVATDANGVLPSIALQGRSKYVWSNVQDETTAEISVPQYNQRHSRVNSDCMVSGTTSAILYSGAANILNSKITLTTVMPNATSFSGGIVYSTMSLRAMSDDGSFHGFISIPPLVFQIGTTTF